MHSLHKSLRLGSAWTLAFFILSFARTILLTPLMLTHWGREVFCFWALILSARALICFLPDSFIRYVINEYNIRFHRDRADAAAILRSGSRFLAFFLLGSCVLILPLTLFWPPVVSFIFDVPLRVAASYHLAESLSVYILAACVQLQQRLYSGLREPQGLIWQNLLMETLLLAAEMLLLGLMIVWGFGFSACMLADSLLIISAATGYGCLLSRSLPAAIPGQRYLVSGVRMFRRAGRLYAGNFFEKASSDGLLLLLSFFRFDKAAIAVFATVKTLVNAPLLGANLLLNAWTPELQRRYALKDKPGLQGLLRLVRAGAGVFIAVAMVCAYPLYRPVFLYWTRGQLPYHTLFLCLMLSAALGNLAGLVYSAVLKGVNALQAFLYLMLLKTALILVGLALFPAGLYTIAWVWCVAELVPGFFLLPLLVGRRLREDGFRADYRESLTDLMPYLFSVLVLAFFGLYGFRVSVLLVYLVLAGLFTGLRFRGGYVVGRNV